jgi:hypothetical protein
MHTNIPHSRNQTKIDSSYIDPSTMLRLMNSQNNFSEKITQIYNANSPAPKQENSPLKGKWPKKKNSMQSKFDTILDSLRNI